MEAAWIDGAMVSAFVSDDDAFSLAVNDVFSLLDGRGDGDGLLSRREAIDGLAAELFHGDVSQAEATADAVFGAFDGHKGWAVGRMEFEWGLGELMGIMASRLTRTPAKFELSKGSLLSLVVEHDQRSRELLLPHLDLDGWKSF